MKNKSSFKTKLAFFISTFSIAACIQASELETVPIDSDSDGLPDLVEIQQGLDPMSRDSDVDGISDADELPSFPSFSLQSPSSTIPDALDTDGDGLNDFLETYGYYVVDNQPTLAPRHILVSEWNALKAQNIEAQGIQIFDLALSRLEQDFKASINPDNAQFLILNLDGAKNAIIDAYIAAGISSTSEFVEGKSNFVGSAANILSTLLKQPILPPRDTEGNPSEIFFTHPLKVSTDHDPFSDLEEALGIFPAGRPLAPADHPLIAAAPYLRATLLDFQVIELEYTRITLGEQESQQTGRQITRTNSHSHGFSIGLKTEWEGSFYGAKFKKSVEIKNDHSWGFSKSEATDQRNTHATYSSTSSNTQSDCFAKLDLTLALENKGYANASNISVSFNVYLGEAELPWETFVVGPDQIGDLLLAPGETHHIKAERTGQKGCLTIDEANYLAQGGVISTETIVADAQVDFFNPSTRLVEQGGSWQVYNNLIQKDLALLNIDVNATNGKQINHSIYYSAQDQSYPNLSLSVEQALAKAFQKTSCDDSFNPNARCFLTEEDDQIVLGPNTFLDIIFYSPQGVSLSNFESQEKYFLLSPVENTDPFHKILPRNSSVSIVNNDFEIPQFTHIEAINLVHADENIQPDLMIRAGVKDFFGLQEVLFCYDQNQCEAMTTAFGNQDLAEHSGMYTITLANHKFTGTEFVKAINIIGNESGDQQPASFFSLLHQSLDDRVSQFSQHLDTLKNRINALSKLQTEDPEKYATYVNYGFVSTTSDAQVKLDALEEQLERALSTCRLTIGIESEDLVTELEHTRQACLLEVNALADATENSKLKVFNLTKLPGKHFNEENIGRTKAGKDRGLSNYSANLKRTCVLGKNQYAVGVAMGKKNDRSTPVDIALKYVEYNPVLEKLSTINSKVCGNNQQAHERTNILKVISTHEAEIILDLGVRLDDNIKPLNGKKSRWIGELCVTYREFNFQTGQWQGARKIKCLGGPKSTFGNVEAQTDLNNKGNSNLALKGLTLYHKENKTSSNVKEVFGYHTKPSRSTVKPGFDYLSEFENYRIKNIDTGKFLTVTSQSANSASLGLRPEQSTESQAWSIERVNDREFRLIPKIYSQGVFVRNPSSEPSVAKLGNNDVSQANYLQHLQISAISDEPNTAYLISSVVDLSSLSASNNDGLAWVDKKNINKDINNKQKWIFSPIAPQTNAKHPPLEHSLVITQSEASNKFLGSCQSFSLDGKYFVKAIKVIGKQSIYNKSSRIISFNPRDMFQYTVYPGNNNFSFEQEFSKLTTRTDRVDICNAFISSRWGENSVDRIEVLAIPTD